MSTRLYEHALYIGSYMAGMIEGMTQLAVRIALIGLTELNTA